MPSVTAWQRIDLIEVWMPASVDLFKRYVNPVFIETGTYLGEGIRHALAAGFGVVIRRSATHLPSS